MAASNAPGMPRKVSCVVASEPSSEIETRLMPAFLDLLRNVFGDQRAVGGQRDAQAAAGGIFGQLEDIGAVKRFASAEHEDGISEVGNLGDDVERFLGGQIVGRHQLRRRGAAMNASQVAALGDLPENQPRRVFLLRRIGRTAIALCHCVVFLSPLLRITARFYVSTIGFSRPKRP